MKIQYLHISGPAGAFAQPGAGGLGLEPGPETSAKAGPD